MRFNDALKEFLAWKAFSVGRSAISGYVNDLRQLALYLGNPEVESVKWEHILKITNDMKELGWHENSFVRKFISYRKFFEFWHKRNSKILDPDWIPIKHMEYRKARVATKEQYQKLLALKPDLRNLVILNLLWDTAARVGEIISLDIRDLDLSNHLAVIKTEKSKGRRPFREIFWTEKTNDNLKKYLNYRSKCNWIKNQEALFVCEMGKARGERIRTSAIQQMLMVLSDKAGIERVNAHSFRHHMGHEIIRNGGTNSDVSNILGHSNLASSFMYTQMQNKELKDRYTQLHRE